jgi:hypothetical protein
LRDVVVVKFPITGKSALLVGRGDGGSGSVSQGEFNDALERERFGQQPGGE